NARALVRQALAEGMACDNCYLNGLMFAVRDGDRELIDATLEQLRESPTFFQRAGNRYFYFRTIAHLELRLGNPESARMALREAIQIEDQEPFAHLLMAEIQMALGEVEAAKTEAALAVALSNPMERADERSRAALVLAGKVVNGTPMREPRGERACGAPGARPRCWCAAPTRTALRSTAPRAGAQPHVWHDSCLLVRCDVHRGTEHET